MRKRNAAIGVFRLSPFFSISFYAVCGFITAWKDLMYLASGSIFTEKRFFIFISPATVSTLLPGCTFSLLNVLWNLVELNHESGFYINCSHSAIQEQALMALA